MAASMVRNKSFSLSLALYNGARTIYIGTEMKANLMHSKIMKKIIKKTERKKDVMWTAPMYEKKPAPNFNKHGKGVKSKQRFSAGMVRRANQIGDVMFDTVCTIISSGQLGVRATILKVDVIPDMTYMNIHWEASGDQEKDEQTQLELNEKASYLRKMLIESKHVWNVPKPVFVKDLSVSKQKMVDELLLQIQLDMKNESVHSPEVVAEYDSDLDVVDIDGLNARVNNDTVSDDLETEFRQDLYEIPHDVLMSKVVTAKLSAAQRPAVMSDITTNIDQSRRFDRDLKKLLTAKKEISKKKLQRQIEREELYNIYKEMNESDEPEKENKHFDDVTEDNIGVETWLQGYHEELSNYDEESK